MQDCSPAFGAVQKAINAALQVGFDSRAQPFSKESTHMVQRVLPRVCCELHQCTHAHT
jgi:hypothetical protein